MIELNKINLYYINLDRSINRKNEFLENIRQTEKILNITFNLHRVTAVDGKDKSISSNIYNYDLLNTSQSKYELACTCSHIFAIKQAYDEGNEYCIIMEDDNNFSPLHNLYDTCIDVINTPVVNYDLLQLCATDGLFNIHKSIYPIVKWKRWYYSTGCYLIKKSGMKNIINKFVTKTGLINFFNCPNLKADYVLYKNQNTYTSTLAFATFQCNESTIHPSYLIGHKVYKYLQNKRFEKYKSQINMCREKCTDFIQKDNSNDLLFISAGDNSIWLYNLNFLQNISQSKIDFVVYYYGDNEEHSIIFQKYANLVVKSKGNKFNNFYKFYINYHSFIEKYEYIGVFDDDISLTSCNKSETNIQLFEKLFDQCHEMQPWIASPSCLHGNENYIESYWINTHSLPNSFARQTFFIQTGTPIFKTTILKYLMTVYPYKQLPSYGNDIWFLEIIGRFHYDKYLIFDNIQYCNPTNIRKIDTYMSLRHEKWLFIYFSLRRHFWLNSKFITLHNEKNRIYSRGKKIVVNLIVSNIYLVAFFIIILLLCLILKHSLIAL